MSYLEFTVLIYLIISYSYNFCSVQAHLFAAIYSTYKSAESIIDQP